MLEDKSINLSYKNFEDVYYEFFDNKLLINLQKLFGDKFTFFIIRFSLERWIIFRFNCLQVFLMNLDINNFTEHDLINISKFENILLSRIGQNGIETICKSLFQNFNYFVNAKQFLSLASITEPDNILKNIDLKNTIEFNDSIVRLFVSRGILTANDSYRADQRWIIYKNNYQLKEYKTIFLQNTTVNEATKYVADNFLNIFLGAVSDVLNKQLDILNAITINLYTDDVNIDGTIKKRFTIDSLKRLINDFEDDPNVIRNLQNGIISSHQLYQQNNPTIDNQIANINTKKMLFNYYEKYIIFILKQFLDINIYIFYMFSINFTDTFRLDTRVKLVSNKNTPYSDKLYIITKIIKQDGQKTKYKLIEQLVPPVVPPVGPPVVAAPALKNIYMEEELEFSDLGQVDLQKWNEPFEIICNDQNHLTNNNDNIIFLLRTTNEYFDYNYEVIGTYTEQYVFNSDDTPIHRYISPLYINTCLRQLDIPVPPIFDASSRGSGLSSIADASGSVFGPPSLNLGSAGSISGFYFDPDDFPCQDNSSDSRSCVSTSNLDFSNEYTDLNQSYQEYLRETPTKEEKQEDAVINKVKQNIKETNKQYDILVNMFDEIYNQKKNINIRAFLDEVNYIKDEKYNNLKMILSHFTDNPSTLDLIEEIDAKLERLNFFETHTQEYMRICDIDNARIEEVISFFSDKEKYYYRSYEEIQEFLALYKYLKNKFKYPKTNIEEYFKERMDEFSQESHTKDIQKMQDYVDNPGKFPSFGDYLKSLTPVETDDFSISNISFHYMPDLTQNSDDVKEIYNIIKKKEFAEAPKFDQSLVNFSPKFLEIYARYNAFIKYMKKKN